MKVQGLDGCVTWPMHKAICQVAPASSSLIIAQQVAAAQHLCRAGATNSCRLRVSASDGLSELQHRPLPRQASRERLA